MQQLPVIAIVGPTASGKTALGIYLAQKLGGEILSADSRQLYRGMRVISRAPTREELRLAKHHLVGIANPKVAFSAGDYAAQGTQALERILGKKHLPIVVGGTGFYADALLRGLSLPEVPPNKTLRAQLQKKTNAQLLSLLKKKDPASAARVDPHNTVRLVRALEIASALGTVPALTEHPPYPTLWLGIQPNEKTYAAVLVRGVESRLKKGMVTEVRALRALLSKKRYESLGFEFTLLAEYMDKKITRAELVERIVQGEIAYAKRQMRWFRRTPDIVWVKNKTEALQRAKAFIAEHA